MDPNGNILDYEAEYYRKFNEQWDFKSVQLATGQFDEGYIVEGRIAMDELKSLECTKDCYLGIFRADFYEPKKVNWYTHTIPESETPDFHLPSAFEKIKLD